MNDSQPWSDRIARHAPVAAALLVAVGFYLRARGLGTFWVNPDEGIYYSTLTQPSFGTFWSEVMENAHPPGYYLLLRGLGFLTWDFVWLRATSALFGAATIWLFWLVGRELGGRGAGGAVTGLLAAALITFNGEAIVVSQVMRPYALLLALLAASLYTLLAWVREPRRPMLAAHAVFSGAALLTHYSAVFGIAVLALLALHERIAGRIASGAFWRLAGVYGGAAALLVVLYVVHLRGLMSSQLATTALDGWLAHWMVSSPREAWRALVDYQIYSAPLSWSGRSAALLVVTVVLSAASRDRRVAVVAGAGLVVALTASGLELYPFGRSRHVTWLVAFTLPALAWLPVGLARLGRGRALGVGIPLAVLLALPLEPVLAPGAMADLRTNATEEQTLRARDLAPLVVHRLDPEGTPRVILMAEQAYFLLMPLYASERHPVRRSADGRFLHFDYGARQVVVHRSWDWDPPFDLPSVVASMDAALPGVVTDRDGTLLVVAGGWGSTLFQRLPELLARGVASDQSLALGRNAVGQPVIRVAAFIVDRERLTGQPGGASLPSTDSSSAPGS